jgi:glutaredoxin 3
MEIIMKAEIYTKTICPYCVRAKKLLTQLNIPYEEYIISAGMGEQKPAPNQYYVTRDHLLERLPTARTVPQIWIDGAHVGGCDDLEAAVKEGKFTQQG